MASKADVIQWKNLYGGVFSVAARGKEYIYRPLTYSEYDEILIASKYITIAEQEDLIVSRSLLSPDISVDKVPPGIVGTIAESVLDNSGFGDPKIAKHLFEQKKAELSAVRKTMYALVMDTLNSNKADLDKLNFIQLSELVLLAEEVISIRQSYADPGNTITFELVDLEEQRKEVEEKNRKKLEQKQRAAERLAKEGRLKDNPEGHPSVLAPSVSSDDPIARRLRQALGG